MILNKQPKQKTAIALEYNPDEAAPKVIATGKGLVAEKKRIFLFMLTAS